MFPAVEGERGGTRGLVHERVRRVARSTPSRVAVSDRVQSLTYDELDRQASTLARRLRSIGVGPGVRVGICHERSAVNVVGALATLEVGGSYVGMDPSYPKARLEYMVRDAEVPVLLADSSTLERLGSTVAELIDLDLELDRLSPEARREDAVSFNDGTFDDRAFDLAAYVIYTSGSTGSPKGVQVSHRNLVSLVDWHTQAFEVGATDRASVLASPAFDASVWELWPYLTVGASLHIPGRDIVTVPERLRDWLVATRITIAFVPTPLAEALLDLPWPNDVALRFMLTGGDVLHLPAATEPPFALVNNYGVAEATVVSTSGLVAFGGRVDRVPGIGRAIAGTRLYVLDADRRPVRAGDAGELYIGGAGVAIGYLNRPDLTADRFLSDPFAPETPARMYRTGDLVRMNAEHEYEFLGRLDTQVQVRGQRVELDEIAAALMAHPTVAQSVVIARDAQPGNVQLIAYVVASREQRLDHQDLRNHVLSRLPGFMVPSAFVELESLPLTSNGKVDRDALRAPEPFVGESENGRTPVEAAIAEILAELLALISVGLHENFFELGGHSLMAAQLLVRIEEQFDVELPMLTVFDNPTAAGIAAAIERDLSPHPSLGA